MKQFKEVSMICQQVQLIIQNLDDYYHEMVNAYVERVVTYSLKFLTDLSNSGILNFFQIYQWHSSTHFYS